MWPLVSCRGLRIYHIARTVVVIHTLFFPSSSRVATQHTVLQLAVVVEPTKSALPARLAIVAAAARLSRKVRHKVLIFVWGTRKLLALGRGERHVWPLQL